MILVTGAGGFIGQGLCRRLHSANWQVVAGVRRPIKALDPFCARQTRLEMAEPEKFASALADCRAVIHLAARVHVMRDDAAAPLAAFRSVNVNATLNLAREAANQGVKRFVFVSSAKVNGEASADMPFSPFDKPAPNDAYAISKWEAEQGLHRIARETELEMVIVRAPLVYGPGVRANFLRLMRLVHAGWPLPLGAIQNSRSMVAVDNLTDLLAICAEHPAAAGRTFMAADGTDVNTAELARLLADAMGRKVVLPPVPPAVLAGIARLTGRWEIAERLLTSLQVDISHTREALGWQPPVEMRQAIRETAAHFLADRQTP